MMSIKSLTGMKVLVIDDDALFCDIIRREGQSLGYEVSVCRNLKEVAEVKDLSRFDVILIDYFLDGMQGTTIASFVNLFFGRIPVVIVSSSSEWWLKTGPRYPRCVKRFVHKERRPAEILRLAKEATTDGQKSTSADDSVGFSDYDDFAADDGWALVRNAYRGVMKYVGSAILSGGHHLM